MEAAMVFHEFILLQYFTVQWEGFDSAVPL